VHIDYKEFTVVLPTLNEKGTIGNLIYYVLKNYRGSRVLVVDDGSRDGTRQIVRGIAKYNAGVYFIDRHAMGLERGLTASIAYGISKSTTKYAIVMDADMQHPPSKIRDISEKLVLGKDLVVANRADVTDWSPYRRAISFLLMCAGRFVLFVRHKETCKDIFSGFFGIRRTVFNTVFKRNKRHFVMTGYKALFDFLKCVKRGSLRIDNVSIVFNSRRSGKSNVGIKQGIACIRSFFN